DAYLTLRMVRGIYCGSLIELISATVFRLRRVPTSGQTKTLGQWRPTTPRTSVIAIVRRFLPARAPHPCADSFPGSAPGDRALPAIDRARLQAGPFHASAPSSSPTT